MALRGLASLALHGVARCKSCGEFDWPVASICSKVDLLLLANIPGACAFRDADLGGGPVGTEANVSQDACCESEFCAWQPVNGQRLLQEEGALLGWVGTKDEARAVLGSILSVALERSTRDSWIVR